MVALISRAFSYVIKGIGRGWFKANAHESAAFTAIRAKRDTYTCVYPIVGRIIDPLALFLSTFASYRSTVCLSKAATTFGNTDFKATVLNYVCFLLRIKIPIIAVFCGCSDKFRIKIDLIIENTRNEKSNMSSNPTNAIAESGMDKTVFGGLGDL